MTNHIQTDAGHQLVRCFEEMLPHLIKDEGFYPLPMLVRTPRGTEFVEVSMPDHKACEVFAKAVRHPEVEAAILGIDRYGDPEEMRTEMRDVLTCTLYEKGSPFESQVRMREQFRFGIIEYHVKPRAIRAINWANRFWIQEMRSELFRFVPDVILGESGQVMLGPDMQRAGERLH